MNKIDYVYVILEPHPTIESEIKCSYRGQCDARTYSYDDPAVVFDDHETAAKVFERKRKNYKYGNCLQLIRFKRT